MTSPLSSKSRAGRNSFGKRAWRVRKRDLVEGGAERRGLEGRGAVEGRGEGGRESKRVVRRVVGVGRGLVGMAELAVGG